MKIIAGCDGHNAQKVANRLQKYQWPISVKDVYRSALIIGFGRSDCLVVITETEYYAGHDSDDDHIPLLFRETLQQPEFNPCWEQGTADYVVIVDVKERK